MKNPNNLDPSGFEIAPDDDQAKVPEDLRSKPKIPRTPMYDERRPGRQDQDLPQ